ncbi:hypothetical protein BGX27_008122 [Mortierella sp. AM989]|nr:hypothetical protein BGX27_008122 [Mortierella sp. AM989]
MDIYCETSISTSSRLSPLEEEELRNSTIGIPHSPKKPSKVGSKIELRYNTNATTERVAAGITDAARSLPKKQKQEQILIAVADKDPKGASNRENDVEGQSQIQATAIMDDLECENLTNWQNYRLHANPAPTKKSPKAVVLVSADSTARDATITKLEPSDPFLIQEQDDHDPSRPKDIVIPKVESSATSILSASPTLTSTSFRQKKDSSAAPHYNLQCQQEAQIQYNTGSLVLEAENPPVSKFRFDSKHFIIILHELTTYTEQIELLNDQILEAMTLHQSMNTDAATIESYTATSPELTSTRRPPSPEETRRRMKGKEKAVDLEEERFNLAQSFTGLVMDSWPRIYKIPSEPKTAQMTRERMKAATKLKDMIVEFWGSQSQFQERAQLVLDVYQDPTELEQGDRIRILKSRHLNNLLIREPLDLQEVHQLVRKYRQHQDKLTALSDQLQNVWLGILMLLGDPDHTQSLKLNRRFGISSMNLHATSSSSSYYLDNPPSESRRSLFRLSKHKRLALKVTLLLAVGSGLIAMAMVLNAK